MNLLSFWIYLYKEFVFLWFSYVKFQLLLEITSNLYEMSDHG